MTMPETVSPWTGLPIDWVIQREELERRAAERVTWAVNVAVGALHNAAQQTEPEAIVGLARLAIEQLTAVTPEHQR